MAPTEADTLYPLLRFKTNLQPETWSSLEDYAGRMKPDKKVIYYIVGEDAKSVFAARTWTTSRHKARKCCC